MQTFMMMCACGQVVAVRALCRADAVKKMQEELGHKKVVKAHWQELHQNDTEKMPTVAGVLSLIQSKVVPAV